MPCHQDRGLNLIAFYHTSGSGCLRSSYKFSLTISVLGISKPCTNHLNFSSKTCLLNRLLFAQ
jgi:hypothetical protein